MHESDNICRETELMTDIQETLQRQHLLLMQKTRAHWLVDGDRNTAFFHRAFWASQAKASINSMMINGVLCDDAEIILEHIQEFYKDLFVNNGGNDDSLLYIKELLKVSVTREQSQELIRCLYRR